MRPAPFIRSSAIALAALLASLSMTPAAGAWEYPLLPHVQGLAFWPMPPTDVTVTYAELSAVYPHECWALASIDTLMPNRINLEIVPGSGCGDSASTWDRRVGLGVLPAGMHSLTVHATILPAGAAPIVEEITVPFEVVAYVPPPPPPPPVDTGNTMVLQAWITPERAQLGQALTLHVRGHAPFDCAQITEAGLVDAANVRIRLAPGGCADTTRAWTQDVALGTPDSAGYRVWMLDVVAAKASGDVHERYAVPIDVIDPNAPPPPPPPPIDSLRAMMSASHPNPFSEESRFSVSLDNPQPADVAVFDVGGRRVATVFHGTLPDGTSQLAWNGRRADGSRASGGLYFYRLSLPGRVVTRRVVLLATP